MLEKKKKKKICIRDRQISKNSPLPWPLQISLLFSDLQTERLHKFFVLIMLALSKLWKKVSLTEIKIRERGTQETVNPKMKETTSGGDRQSIELEVVGSAVSL